MANKIDGRRTRPRSIYAADYMILGLIPNCLCARCAHWADFHSGYTNHLPENLEGISINTIEELFRIRTTHAIDHAVLLAGFMPLKMLSFGDEIEIYRVANKLRRARQLHTLAEYVCTSPVSYPCSSDSANAVKLPLDKISGKILENAEIHS